MPNVLKLGFKQNPTVAVDDCIDLGGSGNTANGSVGYHLLTYSEGTARVDQYGRMVRDLTITCEVRGSTVADSYFKFTEINRYLQRTRMYFEHYSGNIPAQTDLQWHTGRAATLSFQGQGASKMVYWDVLDGQATLPPSTLLGPNNQGFLISPVTIKITVNYCNREAAIILDNLFPMGDFEPPWVITSTLTDPAGGGWNTNDVTLGGAAIALDTTNAKFGTRCLKWVGTVVGGMTSLVIYPPEDCTVVVSFWMFGTMTGGTGTLKLDTTQGVVTTNRLTINTGYSVSGWTQYQSSAISLVANQRFNAQLYTTNPASATTFNLKTDGFGCFRNPVGNVAPVEFYTYGGTYSIPYSNVYGIRGDIEAPFVMSLNYTANITTGNTNWARYFLVGVNPIKWNVDYPLLGLDLQTATGSTSTSLFWGAQGASVTGAPLSGTTTFPLTGPSLGHTISGRPRRYRALMAYYGYSSTSTLVSQVAITLGGDTRTYTIDAGRSGADTTIPIAEDYLLYDLGDFLFPRPGAIGMERTFNLSASDNVAVTFTGSGGTKFRLSGIILLPAEQFAYIDLGTNTKLYNPIISNESTSVKVQLAAQTTGEATTGFRGAGVKNSTYQATGFLSELTSLNISSYYTADSIELEPGDTHLEMLMATNFTLRGPSGQGYFSNFANTTLQPAIIYAPRNLTGAV